MEVQHTDMQIVPVGGGGAGIQKTLNVTPKDPAWVTIVEMLRDKKQVQVAGTSTGGHMC